MVSVAGVSAIIGTILAILTFYYATYLPYISGQNTRATKAFTPVLRAVPGAEAEHIRNSPTPTTAPTPATPGPTTRTTPATPAPRPPGENVDRTPPDIFVPDDFTGEATGPDGAEVSFAVSAKDDVDGSATLNEDGTTTQDDVGGDITISCSEASGSTFRIDTTEVTCNAADAAGNTEEQSFTVTVQDTTPPDIFVPDDFTGEATGPDGAEVSFEVFAEDNVDGAVDVSCNYDSGETFRIGETIVTCTAEDSAGNTAEESFTVTVQEPVPEQPEPQQPDGNVTESG
jgi:HYR domain